VLYQFLSAFLPTATSPIKVVRAMLLLSSRTFLPSFFQVASSERQVSLWRRRHIAISTSVSPS
jgi:hypothetical protein